jgi:hypothetical protein
LLAINDNIKSSSPPNDDRNQLSNEEDQEPLVVTGKTTLNRRKNLVRNPPSMDALNHARAIKADIKDNIAVLQPLDKITLVRPDIANDPENQLINTLRDEQAMTWKDIANFLNQERRNRNEEGTFTESSVYSRYVLSKTRTATSVGEIGFNSKDYKHLRNPEQFGGGGAGTGEVSKAGKKRVKNYDNAKELEANMRKLITEDENLKTPERTEQLVQAVAKVERNFWILVADEMERSTTKLYSPDALAGRYHAI